MSNNPLLPTGMQISIGVKDCRCVKFELTHYAQNNTEKIPDDKYEFGLKMNFNPNEAEGLITIITESHLSTLDEPKHKLAELHSLNIFRIVDFKNIIIKIGDNPPMISPPIVTSLMGLCITALRGMYAVKLEGTIYDNAIFPMMDINKTLETAQQVINK